MISNNRMLLFLWLVAATIHTTARAYSFVGSTARQRVLVHRQQWTRRSTTITPKINDLVMRVSRRSRSKRGDGLLADVNAERIASAGRPGTKRFVNPCKVFVGNLPYQAVEVDVLQFLEKHLGSLNNIMSFKIIRDWKTGQSKGYGFLLFQSPIHATHAMEVCNNNRNLSNKLMGRTLQFHQGRRKLKENELYVKKKKKPAADEQEAAIQEGLQQAEEEYLDEMDQHAMDNDAELFGDVVSDDDDDDYDGDFDEEYPEEKPKVNEPKMNREQRREAAKKLQRRKLPHKGFESQPSLEFDDFTEKQPIWVGKKGKQ